MRRIALSIIALLVLLPACACRVVDIVGYALPIERTFGDLYVYNKDGIPIRVVVDRADRDPQMRDVAVVLNPGHETSFPFSLGEHVVHSQWQRYDGKWIGIGSARFTIEATDRNGDGTVDSRDDPCYSVARGEGFRPCH
ncbi:MAG: hypothetical protein HYZ09_04110 [Candidatus Kerfeldbacteria bacterium]|nr:hypothetical protein [Candidatus Kerfeldbacteria bacterium]